MTIIAVFPSLKAYPERLKEYIDMSYSKDVEKIYIYTKELPNDFENSSKKIFIKVFSEKYKFYLFIKRDIFKVIKNKNRIVIFNHFINFFYIPKKKRKKQNIKIITSFYSPNLYYFYSLKNIYSSFFVMLKDWRFFILCGKRVFFDIISLVFSDILICNSKDIEVYLGKIVGTLRIKRDIFTFPTSVDTEFFNFRKDKFFKEPFRLLFVGNILERKGIFDFINVIKMLNENKIKYKSVILGKLKNKVRKKILKISEKSTYKLNINILSFLNKEELKEVYHISDILIFPSRYEGSPRVIKEALSCGLPVVSYDLEGIKIIDCGSAIIPMAKTGDVGGLFDIISKMIKDKRYLNQLSLNGRTHVENHFSTSVIVKNRIQFIKKIFYQ